MAYRILVADDEREIRDLLKLYLENEKYEVIEAEDGQQALDLLRKEQVDMCLLDIMMPKVDGYHVLQELRKESNIPVIILSAKDADSEKILGLNLGADDYIAKPFNPLEAVARVNSNIRRYYSLVATGETEQVIKVRDLELDTTACSLKKAGEVIDLTSVEYRIMELFMKHPGKVFTKQQIYEYGWGEEFIVADNNIMVCISKLRSKLENNQGTWLSSGESMMKRLQNFLIKKFIILLVVVGAVEFLINHVINVYFFPVMQKSFFANVSFREELSGGQIKIILLIVLLQIIVNMINAALHLVGRIGIEGINDLIGRYYADPSSGSPLLNNLSSAQIFLLFLFIVAIYAMVAAPYAISAFYYVRAVTREVAAIAGEQEAERQEYDRRRNLMLSDIAHDLRTPITTISGYAQALKDNVVQEEQKRQEYLQAIENKSRRMSDLINLLFEYVKIDSDGFSLDREELDLCELLRENAALIYQDMEDAGMDFEVDVPEEKYMINADRVQMSRVITNLMVNAIRHNQPGTKILLSLTERMGLVTVRVADTGSPIPEDIRETLFEPFSKGDKSRSDGKGSGLGLSIAKKVIDMHGYNLSLEEGPAGYTKSFTIKLHM